MSDPQEIKFCSVILDTAVDKALDYSLPEELVSKAKVGMRVEIPVRGKLCKGTLIALKAKADFPRTLPIKGILSEKPLVSPELFALATWMSQYYACPFRKVLRLILPPTIRKETKDKKQLFITSVLSSNELLEMLPGMRQKNPIQASVLDVVINSPKGILLSELLEKANVSKSPVDTLIKKKILDVQAQRIDRSLLAEHEHFFSKAKTLNKEQGEAFEKIKRSIDEGRFETHLLFGITGSGKTEIYIQAIAHALKIKKKALFLVPEISLTSQTIERLKSRFKEKMVILHHRLSDGERHDGWQEILEGRAEIVVGARSALFCPLPDLKLIIVDEEHDSSYKQQDEMPCYSARDVAVMRAKLESCTVILGSATPSIESYYNAQSNKYVLSLLTTRPEEAHLPKVQIVDMRKEFEKAKGFTLFSEALLQEIKKRADIGEQSVLFLNRRGYHTARSCKACGHIIKCPHCDVSLTFHLSENILACHHCDYRLYPPRECPSCRSEDGMQYKGAGTEMVERALHALLPDIRTLRLDADTTRHKGSHEMSFKQFRAGKADVLIGTQMVAKGFHFPSVTLVGVLNADGALNIPDFRASEHTFQLLTQVAGRSGRGEIPGQVIIQTHIPDQETILLAAAQDYPSFFTKELEVRKAFQYPPFVQLMKFVFIGEDADFVQIRASSFRTELLKFLPKTFELHPPVPSGHAKIKDQFRFQFLLKGPKGFSLGSILTEAQSKFSWGEKVKLHIDVDPISTYF